MVASCYRRSGDYTAALEKYKWIHQHFPDDTDCKIELTLSTKKEMCSSRIFLSDEFFYLDRAAGISIYHFFKSSIFRVNQLLIDAFKE